MQETTNIGLKTYEANDPTDWLGEFNYNMNKIDTAVGSQNDQIDVIEETASTAVSTANTASTTATNALNTANTKASIDDLVSSTTTTYSSDKIDDLISGIQPGTEIDDTTTSTTSTWSSSKINTQINTKASINDTTAGSTTTYSSNKINDLLDDIDPIPYTGNSANTVTNHTATVTTFSTTPSVKKLATDSITITTPGYYYLTCETINQSSTDRTVCFSTLTCEKNNNVVFSTMKDQPKRNSFNNGSSSMGLLLRSDIYYIPANSNITFEIYSDYFLSNSYPVQLHKIN